MNDQDLQKLERQLKEQYPFGIPRKRLQFATGGILHPRTAANLDSLGQGIPGRFKINRMTIYPVADVISYIQSKTNEINAKAKEDNNDE